MTEADLVGQMLGPYRILARLSEGGAAVVYRGYQDSMQRYVAIKVLKVDLVEQDPTFVERFKREARTVAQLQHPHILPVIDFGQTEQAVYLVMVLLEGGTLRHLLRERGALTLDECAFLIAQIASALDRAHSRGVIHRDLKPENILMDDDQNAYLTDFGIARILEGVRRLTATGMLLGTPQYIAPEQATGGEADVRSDVYSLGVMLYEMVTGRLPFEGKDAYRMLVDHVEKAPPPPRAIKPDVPPTVETVILQALAKDPDERYQSALALAETFVDALPQAPAISAQAEARAEQMPLGAVESDEVQVIFTATPPTASHLTPRRMTEEDKITITDFEGDDRERIPTTNGYMHYTLRALEEVAGLQATEVILRFAGMEDLLDNYPPNNLKMSTVHTFRDFSNLNHAIINYYGAAGKEAAMHIGRAWARWMLMEQPFFGFTSMALRIMPTVAALRLAINKGSESIAKLYRDAGFDVDYHVVEKAPFFLVAIRECPCCVGKRANVPICWIWEALFLEGGHIIKAKTFPVKEVACRATGDPYCVYRIGKKPLD